jgi:hypothetical protein
MSFEMTEPPAVEGAEDEPAAVGEATGGANDRTSPNKVNGTRKTRKADGERPIEVDSSEKSLKRKASNRLPGSPSGPLQKRLKDEEGSMKSTINEELPDPETTSRFLIPNRLPLPRQHRSLYVFGFLGCHDLLCPSQYSRTHVLS